MKIEIKHENTTVVIENPDLGSQVIQDIIKMVTAPVAKVPSTSVTATIKSVQVTYDVDDMSKQAGLDLRTCSSVHKLITLAPSFVMGLKPKGFLNLVDWLCEEGWLSYRPEDKSLQTYYNKAQRALRT